MLDNLFRQFDEAIQKYNPEKFTNLNDEWRGLVGWNNYYRWLWAAVSVLKPKTVVEIGRERGVSATVILDALPADSTLTTIDIIEESIFLSDIVDDRLRLITTDSLDAVAMGAVPNNIDFLFIDGNHDGIQVVKEWEIYRPKLADKAVVVFDDIHFNEKMTEFWDSITDKKYDISNWHEKGFGVVFIGYE